MDTQTVTTNDAAKQEAKSEALYDQYTTTRNYERFELMPLDEDVKNGIYLKGFDRPSPIQQKGIVPIIQRQHVRAIAQSGTGKTATFCIAAIQLINVAENNTQVVVLCPTRELSYQVQAVSCELGEKKKISVKSLVGGTALRNDIQDMKNGTHMVVGCPGRIAHLVTTGDLNLSFLKLLVLDEADELMSLGFENQIHDILAARSQSCTLAFFSATYSIESTRAIESICPNPLLIEAQDAMMTLDGLQQFYVMVTTPEHKRLVIDDLYGSMNISQTIIYVNRRDNLRELHHYLEGNGHSISFICAEMTPLERQSVMQNFRNGTIRILLATDLLARGIDVQQISLVMNFDLPPQIETYIHRIGRSGRYGRKGIAINIITEDQWPKIGEIERHYQCEIAALPLNFADVVNEVARSHLAQ